MVERVKTLEVALKRKTKRVLLSDFKEEETEAQGRKFYDLDPLVSLVQELVTPSKTPLKTVNASGEVQDKKLHLSLNLNHHPAILTLVERVKTLEVALKRKTNRVLLSDFKEEEIEAQGRKFYDLDPLVSLVQELVTPSKTVNASGEEQVEDISPTTLEATAILTKVHKIKSVDKGNRYKRRKSSKEFAGTGLDFEEVKSAFEKVSTGGIKVSSGIEEINTGSLDINTGIDPVTTDNIRVSVPSPDIGLDEAIRLDALEKALEKEEVAKQVHLDSLLAQRMAEEKELTEEQKKRKAQVQFEAQSYTEED
ncbi:hypothetical protein Tco_0490960 [Tanacetum coccineum]